MIAKPLVLEPAIYMPALGVVVGPVEDAPLDIPLVFSEKRNARIATIRIMAGKNFFIDPSLDPPMDKFFRVPTIRHETPPIGRRGRLR